MKLVERWLAKDATPFKGAVAELVREEWAIRGLDPDKLIEALQESCTKALGDSPEVIFAKLTEPLNALDINKPEEAKQGLNGVLKCMDEILGKPEEFMGSTPGTLAEPMTQSAEARVNHWSSKLAAFAVSLLEQPEYRLAGAEAAFRELVNTIEKVCNEQEPLVRNSPRAGRMRGIGSSNSSRAWPAPRPAAMPATSPTWSSSFVPTRAGGSSGSSCSASAPPT
jgi:hypothetical protein